jgi:peptide/nickel transport system substrate-binding protein
MKGKLKYGVFLAGVLAILALDVAGAAADGVLTVGRQEDSNNLDPVKAVENVNLWVFASMYDVLIRVDPTGTKLEPGLAESWTVSDDQLTYTLKLRDAKFSDGSPITAEDAAYNVLRIRDHKESAWGSSYAVVKDAKAADAKTLVITLNQPTAPFLAWLAMPSLGITQKKQVAANEASLNENPVSSGAFILKEWRKGERLRLEKNPNYWQADKVSLDAVEWVSVPDDNTRMLNVQAGELDCAIFVPFSQIESLKADPNLNVMLDPSSREDHLLINNASGDLAKVEVRQALDMAIDKQAIVDTVTFGAGEVANSFVPKGALYYYAANKNHPYDPDGAKALLDKAGVKDLTLNYVVQSGNETDEQTAVLVQQQLAKIGVTANINKVDASQFVTTLVDGKYDLGTVYWTNDIIDPDEKVTFAAGHDSNNNFWSNYKNDKVKQLVADARVEADPAKREQMYFDIQKTMKDEVAFIDLYTSPFRNVCGKKVSGFVQYPLGLFSFQDVKKGS